MTRYSIAPRRDNVKGYMSKDMDFCRSREICLTNMESNYWILLLKQEEMLYKLLLKR